MAFLEVKNVRIAGMSAGVPKRVINNLEQFNDYSKDYDAEAFVEQTGVLERRVDNIPTVTHTHERKYFKCLLLVRGTFSTFVK